MEGTTQASVPRPAEIVPLSTDGTEYLVERDKNKKQKRGGALPCRLQVRDPREKRKGREQEKTGDGMKGYVIDT